MVTLHFDQHPSAIVQDEPAETISGSQPTDKRTKANALDYAFYLNAVALRHGTSPQQPRV